MKQKVLFIVLMTALAAGILFYYNYEQPINEPVLGDSQTNTKLAPDFALVDTLGNQVTLRDYNGQVVLLNFWTTWCPYCKKDIPEMKRLYEEHQDDGLVVLSINLTSQEENAAAVKEFVSKEDYKFPVLLDLDGEVMSIYGIRSLPTSMIINRQGEIIDLKIGPYGNKELETKILNTL